MNLSKVFRKIEKSIHQLRWRQFRPRTTAKFRHSNLLNSLNIQIHNICFVVEDEESLKGLPQSAKVYFQEKYFEVQLNGELIETELKFQIEYWFFLGKNCRFYCENLLEILRLIRSGFSEFVFYFDGMVAGKRQFNPKWSPTLDLMANYTEGLIVVKNSNAFKLGKIDFASPQNCLGQILDLDSCIPVAVPMLGYTRDYNLPGQDSLVVEEKLDESVEIVIPTKNSFELIQNCIESILNLSTYKKIQICIVDNQSNDEQVLALYADWQRKYPGKIRVIHFEESFNFGKMVNLGVTSSKSNYILLLNNDTKLISPAWIEEMLSFAMMEEVGAVGACLLFENNTIQHLGIDIDPHLVALHPFRLQKFSEIGNLNSYPHEVSAITGACLLCSRKDYLAVSGFDDFNFPNGYGDVDFCLKLMEMGKRNLVLPRVKLYHLESISRAKNIEFQERILMRLRWKEKLIDPYRNSILNYSRKVDLQSLSLEE